MDCTPQAVDASRAAQGEILIHKRCEVVFDCVLGRMSYQEDFFDPAATISSTMY